MENVSQGMILVVDDRPENLGVLFDYLDQKGFTVLLVQNGANALKQAEQNQPDIILLDVMMPDVNGFEVCRRLKANDRTKEIPVIFITALSETVDKIRGFEVGGVDYITKPFQHEEVVARVKTHITICKLQRELMEKSAVLQQYVELLAQKNTELDEKNLQLQELNVNKDRFFSIISHDLRSPFVGLLGLTQLLTDDLDNFSREQLHAMLGKLRKSTEHLYALLENLLTWSRLQRGLIECHPQRVNLHEIVSRNLKLLTPNADQKNIRLEHAVPEKTVVKADIKMIDTIVRNLVSNAVKFTPSGGRVTVSAASHNEGLVRLTVCDSGIGIDPEYLPKLFRIDTKYTRLGTADERGTGLGLILCKDFVERNGGTIWVESERNQGAAYHITLPKNQE